MKITAYSREAAISEQFNGNEKVWISINDESYESPIVRYETLVTQRYDDVAPFHVEIDAIHPYYKREFNSREPIYFNEKMADEVLNLGMHCVLWVSDIHVHCFAGKSRSVATVQALNEIFNLFYFDNREEYMENLQRVVKSVPNSFVYTTIMKRFMEREKEITKWFDDRGLYHVVH